MSLLRKLQIFSSDVAKLWNIDVANTARTTSTVVGAVQVIDATGKVSPAGDTSSNAPYCNITYPQATATKVTIGAGATVTVKASAGYVMAVYTVLTDLVIKNDTTEIWNNNYSSAHPFYCGTSIKLTSTTGGDAFVVYL
jgi:hypothetical protein